MTDLFCTPEQGKRLKELLPELEYAMAWAIVWEDWEYKHTDVVSFSPFMFDRKTPHSPAFTLQELRDLCTSNFDGSDNIQQIDTILWNGTASQLADWVIARLEEHL